MDYSLNVHVVDPLASPNEVAHEYGIAIVDQPVGKYDAIIVAVGHDEYQKLTKKDLEALSKNKLILFDIKGIYDGAAMKDVQYWRL